MKTNEQIARETIEFYSADPKARRAVRTIEKDGEKNDVCMYRYLDRKCAIGRYIPDEVYSPMLENKDFNELLQIEMLHMNDLVPEVREASIFVLRLLQKWHDSNPFWSVALNKPSPKGETVANLILEYAKQEDHPGTSALVVGYRVIMSQINELLSYGDEKEV